MKEKRALMSNYLHIILHTYTYLSVSLLFFFLMENISLCIYLINKNTAEICTLLWVVFLDTEALVLHSVLSEKTQMQGQSLFI